MALLFVFPALVAVTSCQVFQAAAWDNVQGERGGEGSCHSIQGQRSHVSLSVTLGNEADYPVTQLKLGLCTL